MLFLSLIQVLYWLVSSYKILFLESQAIQLDIRIYQLDYGIKIELWQEAFKGNDQTLISFLNIILQPLRTSIT